MIRTARLELLPLRVEHAEEMAHHASIAVAEAAALVATDAWQDGEREFRYTH